ALQAQAELAQQELQRLDESKSRFISVAAHELKTPLTLIDGYASMLRDRLPSQVLTPETRQLLEGISSGTRRLQNIINDMLDVSLIDNNLLQLSFQPLWLDQVLDILKHEVQPLVDERRQNLKINGRNVLHKMTYGDPERLYQAFMHLLNNAIKFTPDGGSITLDARMLPGFVEITITDTGIGIDPADQDEIFQKFGRLGDVLRHHSSGKTKFKGGGPGLGLPIAKGIIEAHGGTVWVESPGYDEEKCPGSTFHVLLPLRNAPPDTGVEKLFATVKES
ncbi:MAG: sensor histidine kinase, partial [Anaerolineae bacterium]